MTGIHQLLFSNFAVSGGTVVVRIFTGTNQFSAPPGVTSVDYLVVGGGGGGGNANGGGGGAGGFGTGTNFTVVPLSTYNIVVRSR